MLFLDHCLLEAIKSDDPNSADEVDRLLNEGANANAYTPSGGTMLHEALPLLPSGSDSATLQLQKVTALVRHGANASAMDKSGNTALMHACVDGSVALVDCLLSVGADPNLGNFTPLMAAVAKTRYDVAAHLINATANVPSSTFHGKSVMTLAFEGGNVAMIALVTKALRAQKAALLFNWVLALAPLELPIYIYLELADRALNIEELTEMEKVNIIQRVMDSYRRVVRERATIASNRRLA